jgi:hypothetical protein
LLREAVIARAARVARDLGMPHMAALLEQALTVDEQTGERLCEAAALELRGKTTLREVRR